MEKFQIERELAKRKIKIADHIISVTYPLVKDTRLLLGVLENIYFALMHSVTAILEYDRLFKRIPPFQDDEISKLNMFRARVSRRYNIDVSYITLIEGIKMIIYEHKKSPVEFARKDKFVICSDNYRMQAISIEQIKEYVQKTKKFIVEMDNLVSNNERIFR